MKFTIHHCLLRNKSFTRRCCVGARAFNLQKFSNSSFIHLPELFSRFVIYDQTSPHPLAAVCIRKVIQNQINYQLYEIMEKFIIQPCSEDEQSLSFFWMPKWFMVYSVLLIYARTALKSLLPIVCRWEENGRREMNVGGIHLAIQYM